MAIYKGTALVSQIIGKLGTQDFMRWKNKNVVRTSPLTVTDPHSTRQTAMRDAMATSGAAWFGTLTQAQRDAWETYALLSKNKRGLLAGIRNFRIGNGGSFGGYNAFVMTNQILGSAGMTPVEDPPLTESQPEPIFFGAVWDELNTAISITWTDPGDLPAGTIVRVWIDSEQQLFHRQILDFGDVTLEELLPTQVRGANGAAVNLTDFRESYVLLSNDFITPTGVLSKPSDTFRLEIPVAP